VGRWHVTHFALIAVCAVTIAFGPRTLYQSERHTGLLQIGRLIADDEPVSASLVASVHDDIQSLVTGGLCRSDLLAAGLRATLKDLDYQNSYSDYEAWSLQIMSAEQFLTHALSCRPTDGDLWVRLAMVRWAVGELPEEQEFLMRMSHQHAPAEQNIIRARIVQWGRLSKASLEALETEFSSDVQVMLLKFPIKEVVAIINAGSAQIKLAAHEASLILSQDRREQLKTVGADLDALIVFPE
jgi:hypothetical protein